MATRVDNPSAQRCNDGIIVDRVKSPLRSHVCKSAPAARWVAADAPPAWVARWLGAPAAVSVHRSSEGPARLTRRTGEDCTLVSVVIADARRLRAGALAHAVADAYRLLFESIASAPHRHPTPQPPPPHQHPQQRRHTHPQHPHHQIVRMWNVLPGLRDTFGALDATIEPYMAFNAGRLAAFERQLGGEAAQLRSAPAGTGVGFYDDPERPPRRADTFPSDLVIHALAMAQPGVAIENPRQTPARLYSRQYGPRPPCFARATRVGFAGRDCLLVSGTAAITGEASQFPDNPLAQLNLTLLNMTALLRTGAQTSGATRDATGGASAWRRGATMAAAKLSNPQRDMSDKPPGQLTSADAAQALGMLQRLTDVRVYLPRPGYDDVLTAAVLAALPRCAIEFCRAELCRRELLIEIEALAELPLDPGGQCPMEGDAIDATLLEVDAIDSCRAGGGPATSGAIGGRT